MADIQAVQSPAGGEPFSDVTASENRQAARLAFWNVAEDPVGPLGTLRSEIVVGGRVVPDQPINEAWRGNFIRFVGWAIFGERFTVGHGVVQNVAVFSVVFGVGLRLAGVVIMFKGAGCRGNCFAGKIRGI